MLKLYTIKKEKEEAKAAPAAGRRVTPAELRLQADFADLTIPSTERLEFHNGPDDLTQFTLILKPDEGLYKGGTFVFSYKIPIGYPHEPPKVMCVTKVYHPNIDPDGNICLNILREDWKPVLSIQSTLYGLQFLFLEPNPDDPLPNSKDVAIEMKKNPAQFKRKVQESLRWAQSEAHTRFVK